MCLWAAACSGSSRKPTLITFGVSISWPSAMSFFKARFLFLVLWEDDQRTLRWKRPLIGANIVTPSARACFAATAPILPWGPSAKLEEGGKGLERVSTRAQWESGKFPFRAPRRLSLNPPFTPNTKLSQYRGIATDFQSGFHSRPWVLNSNLCLIFCGDNKSLLKSWRSVFNFQLVALIHLKVLRKEKKKPY